MVSNYKPNNYTWRDDWKSTVLKYVVFQLRLCFRYNPWRYMSSVSSPCRSPSPPPVAHKQSVLTRILYASVRVRVSGLSLSSSHSQLKRREWLTVTAFLRSVQGSLHSHSAIGRQTPLRRKTPSPDKIKRKTVCIVLECILVCSLHVIILGWGGRGIWPQPTHKSAVAI